MFLRAAVRGDQLGRGCIRAVRAVRVDRERERGRVMPEPRTDDLDRYARVVRIGRPLVAQRVEFHDWQTGSPREALETLRHLVRL